MGAVQRLGDFKQRAEVGWTVWYCGEYRCVGWREMCERGEVLVWSFVDSVVALERKISVGR